MCMTVPMMTVTPTPACEYNYKNDTMTLFTWQAIFSLQINEGRS